MKKNILISINKLEIEKAKHIKKGNYEYAAIIRDKIRVLNEKIK